MTTTPDISVVMGVYNGAGALPETIDSVLSQDGVSLEFIVVDDGSTDATPEVLEHYQRLDSRVKILRQEHQGLTKALIKGCDTARGKFIARQDVGDMSLPGRLSRQLELLTSSSDVSFVSCGTRFVGPQCELLYEVLPQSSDQTSGLLTLDIDRIKGPSMHGCTMFPRDKYTAIGGYRSAFYFAQDLDLWIRLAEKGKHLAVPDVLYQAGLSIGSITSRYRRQQVATAKLILESARLRRATKNDQTVLQRAAQITPRGAAKSSGRSKANALYFIGACLRQRRDPQAAHYFQRALQAHPLHFKSALRLITG